MIDQLKDALTSLSDKALSNALSACQAAGFNQERGDIPLGEAVDNLQHDRDLLLKLLGMGVLGELPTAARQEALTTAQQALAYVTQLAGGQDAVPQLAQAAERLRDFIWRYHLRLLTKELVGFESARQRLKQIMAEARRNRTELEAALARRTNLEALITEGDRVIIQVRSTAQAASEAASEAAKRNQEALNAAEQARSSMTTAASHETQMSELLADCRTKRDEVATINDGLRALFEESESFREEMQKSTEGFRSQIDKTSATAGAKVAEMQSKADLVIGRVQEQQALIDDLLQKATGESLFRAFEQRREELTRSKWVWAGALLLMVVASGVASVWIARSAVHLTEAFYIKLAMAPVLAFGLWFCTVQYGRERKLEEEYAFKSKVSLSLSAYKDLVETVVGPDEAGRDKYSTFVVDSVGRVFSSPISEVFIVKERGLSARLLNQVAEALGCVVKAVRP